MSTCDVVSREHDYSTAGGCPLGSPSSGDRHCTLFPDDRQAVARETDRRTVARFRGLTGHHL